MISRRSSMLLGEIFQTKFRTSYRATSGSSYKNDLDALYDFLYEHEYASWFCNLSKGIKVYDAPRGIKELVMKLHTGETSYTATKTWSWDQREALGQSYLVNLSEDILNLNFSNNQLCENMQGKLKNSLALDGYVFKNGKLFLSEVDVLDTEEEAGVLESLYLELNLDNKDTALHHLKLSTEHYTNGKWSDSISNSRNFMEAVLREIAASFYQKVKKSEISKRIYESPKDVRNTLESEGLLEPKEQKAIAAVYGLLSNTGSHPYIADNDQARLLRHLSLTITHFVLLRYQGAIKEEVYS